MVGVRLVLQGGTANLMRFYAGSTPDQGAAISATFVGEGAHHTMHIHHARWRVSTISRPYVVHNAKVAASSEEVRILVRTLSNSHLHIYVRTREQVSEERIT